MPRAVSGISPQNDDTAELIIKDFDISRGKSYNNLIGNSFQDASGNITSPALD